MLETKSNILLKKSLTIPFYTFIFFTLSDLILDNSIWSYFLKSNKQLTSSEYPTGNFIKRWYNAHSSILFIIIGCLINNKIKKIDKLVGYTFMMLGLASYFWWSSEINIMWKIDNALMEFHLISLLIFIFSKLYNVNENMFITSFIIMFIYRCYYIEKCLIYNIGLILLLSYLYLIKNTIMCNIKLFLLAITFIIISLYFKHLDINEGFIYGTSLLHIFYSFGYYFLYKSIS